MMTQPMSRTSNPLEAAVTVINPRMVLSSRLNSLTVWFRDRLVDLRTRNTGGQVMAQETQPGDLSDIEGMLVAQAVALQTISANFLNRAQMQPAQRNLEAFFGLGLKAQSQSRATIQALIELKFPRQTVFGKNVGNVNNGHRCARPAQLGAGRM